MGPVLDISINKSSRNLNKQSIIILQPDGFRVGNFTNLSIDAFSNQKNIPKIFKILEMSHPNFCLFLKGEKMIVIYDLNKMKIEDFYEVEESTILNFCYLRYTREIWILCKDGLIVVLKLSKDEKNFLKNFSFQFNIESNCEFCAIGVEDTDEESYLVLTGQDLEEDENVIDLFKIKRDEEEGVEIDHLFQETVKFVDSARKCNFFLNKF